MFLVKKISQIYIWMLVVLDYIGGVLNHGWGIYVAREY